MPTDSAGYLPTEALIRKAQAQAEANAAALLKKHLQLIAARQLVSVSQFRQEADLGSDAADTLLALQDAGFLTSVWRNSKMWYSLTEAGYAHLRQ